MEAPLRVPLVVRLPRVCDTLHTSDVALFVDDAQVVFMAGEVPSGRHQYGGSLTIEIADHLVKFVFNETAGKGLLDPYTALLGAVLRDPLHFITRNPSLVEFSPSATIFFRFLVLREDVIVRILGSFDRLAALLFGDFVNYEKLARLFLFIFRRGLLLIQEGNSPAPHG